LAFLLGGFVDGLLADRHDLTDCITKSRVGVQELEEVFATLSRDPLSAMRTAVNASWSLFRGLRGCRAAPGELAAWQEVLARLPHPEELAGNVTKNIHDSAEDIRAELALGIGFYLAERWSDAGLELGMALRRVAMGRPVKKPLSLTQAVGTYCAGIFPQGKVPKFHVTANMTVHGDLTLDYHYHEDVFGHRVRMDCPGEKIDYDQKTGELDVSHLFANKTNCMAKAVGHDPSHLSGLINHVQFDGESFHWTNGWGVQKYSRIPDGEFCPYPPQPVLV